MFIHGIAHLRKSSKGGLLSTQRIPSQSHKNLIPEESLKDVKVFMFFFKAVLKLFTVFYWESSCFLRVYFRILLGQA